MAECNETTLDEIRRAEPRQHLFGPTLADDRTHPHAFVALEEGDHRQEVRSPWIPRGSNMRKIAQGGLPTGSTTHLNRAQIVQREAVGS